MLDGQDLVTWRVAIKRSFSKTVVKENGQSADVVFLLTVDLESVLFGTLICILFVYL